MKEISLLLLFITLFSACNKETEEIEDATINANNSSITQRDGVSMNNGEVTPLTTAKMQMYSYAIGHVFETHFQETTSQFEAYTYTNAVGQKVVSLKQLINESFTFKIRFIQALEYIKVNGFGILPLSRMRPPIGNGIEGANLAHYYATMDELINELAAIYNGSIPDNIEIYMPRAIDSNGSSMRIAPHPLINANSTNGYIFNEGNIANSAATFNANFLNSHNENVLIVRPYRDASHPYNDIPVSDFTLFYN